MAYAAAFLDSAWIRAKGRYHPTLLEERRTPSVYNLLVPTPLWRVEMLGTLQARREGNVVSRFRTRRVGMLLAYLAYFSGQSHDRAEVGELLWPEGDPDKTGGNLRQALASLRRQIEPPPLPAGSVIRSQNGKLNSDPEGITTDVAEFQRSVDAARREADVATRRALLEQAVTLYKGELLPGYHDDWVLRERARLEDAYAHALRMLAQCAQDQGEVDQAIDALHRALASDPYSDELHADLMRAYLDAGEAEKAMAHYRQVKARLAAELGVRPDERLRALVREAHRVLPVEPVSREHRPVLDDAEFETIRLPVQLSRLYGHQEALASLVAEFVEKDAAFVTLLGPAGAGKTTLAVALARRLAEEEGWQVGFVPMADFADAANVPSGVADAFRASRSYPGDVFRRIRSALAPEANLVVLDNAEHILEELAHVVSSLREEIPELRLLVTSRQSLKVADEREFVVRLLDVPSGEDRPDRLSQYPSVALFVDRARSTQPDFGLTPRNAHTVAEICARLDGLPLAIELAAGLCGVFTPTQMLGHLEHRLNLLKTRRRDAPLRHRSLSAALGYSFDTLSEDQRRFFSRLSVFSGGFTVSTATAVASREMPSETLQLLLDLQERSLVFSGHTDDEPDTPRFRLLESFREYGLEHLSEEERKENATRHAEHFLGLLPSDVNVLRAGELGRFRRHAIQEAGNYRGAMHHLIALGREDDAVRILASVTPFGPLGNPSRAEYDVLRALDPARLSLRSQVHVAQMIGIFQRATNAEEGYATAERALGLARALNDPVMIVKSIGHMAAALSTRGELEAALRMYSEILSYGQCAGTRHLIAYSHNGLGTCLWMLGRLDEAGEAFRDSLRLSEEEWGEETNWLARYNLARVLLDQGCYEEALVVAGDADRIARRIRDTFGVSMAAGLVARYRWKTDDLQGAIASSREVVALRRRVALVFWFANAIRFHAYLLADAGESELAATLLAATERHTKDRRNEVEETGTALAKIRAALAHVVFRRAWERGLTIGLEEAFETIA